MVSGVGFNDGPKDDFKARLERMYNSDIEKVWIAPDDIHGCRAEEVCVHFSMIVAHLPVDA